MNRQHPRETLNRARKATLIADVLVLHGAGSVAASALPEAGRVNAARLAGVTAPSASTWAAVIGILEAREQRPARVAVNVEALVG